MFANPRPRLSEYDRDTVDIFERSFVMGYGWRGLFEED